MASEVIEHIRTVVEQVREVVERMERRLDRMERTHERSVVKEAYTIKETAERLGRSAWTVREWCNKRQVDGAYKVRGKGRTGEWRLPHAALARLQAEGPKAVGTAALAA